MFVFLTEWYNMLHSSNRTYCETEVPVLLFSWYVIVAFVAFTTLEGDLEGYGLAHGSPELLESPLLMDKA